MKYRVTLSQPITQDVLKELQGTALTFFKLDLAYLAAAGSVVSIFKLDLQALISKIDVYRFLPFVLAALVLADALLLSVIVALRMDKPRLAPSSTQRFVRVQAQCQPLYHAFAITLTVIGFTGYAMGRGDVDKQYFKRSQVQDVVDEYIRTSGSSPKSLGEVTLAVPRIQTLLTALNEPMSYLKRGRIGYLLVFGGEDKMVGTEDDVTISYFFNLRDSLKEIRGVDVKSSVEKRVQEYFDDQMKVRAQIQDQLNTYISKTISSPHLISEFLANDMKARELMDDLGELLEYKKIGNRGYELLFSGGDQIFGTTDDHKVTDQFSLRAVLEAPTKTPRERKNAQ